MTETHAIDSLRDTLAQVVTSIRKHRGWSRRQLAARMNYAPSYISLLESGKRLPSVEFMEHLLTVANAKANITIKFL